MSQPEVSEPQGSLKHDTVPLNVAHRLPDLHLPELSDPLGSSPPAPGQSVLPSVLQKLQKWGDYPSYGEPVKPTLFVPCKTPLSISIHRNWTLPTPPLHGLTVPQLLSEQAKKQRMVGLILDLSNHETLYEDDLPHGLEYEHIKLQSKAFPHPAAIDEVVRAAQSFWRRQPSQYIAIHCAYGFNRTGFVVCSYLIQACGLSVDAALASFKAARPPGVKHEQFVAELHERYPAASSRHQPGAGREAGAPLKFPQAASESAPLQETGEIWSGPGRGPVQSSQSQQSISHPSSEGPSPADPSAASEPRDPSQDSAVHSSADLPMQSIPADNSCGHQTPLANGLRQQWECSNGGNDRLPAQAGQCNGSLHSSQTAAAESLHKAPSHGAENDSLGLDQRSIMQELAASRLKARSQRRLETLYSEGSAG